MSNKNKSSKNGKNGKTANHPKLHVLDHDPTPQELTGVIVQLRETIDDVRIKVLRQLNEALELCEAAIRPTVIKPVKPAVNPVVRPITPTVLPKKPAAKKPEAKKQDKQDKLTPGLHPVFRESAQKAFQNLADSRKKAAEAAKPHEPANQGNDTHAETRANEEKNHHNEAKGGKMSNKKTTAVAETMPPEDTVKALISVRDGLKALKAATDQLATILSNLGTLAGLAKDGVVAATAEPAAKPPRYAKPPTTPREAVARLAEALGEAPDHVRRAAAEVRAEYGWKPESEKPAGKQSAPKPAKQPTKKKPGQRAPQPQAKPKPKAEPTDMQTGKKPAPQPQVKRASTSVRLTPHELTLNIGAAPVKELAEQDAKEFLGNPKVFWYRQLQFPDPKRYGVQPRITSARVVERTNPKFTRSPWTVSVTIEARGDDKRCASWLSGVLTRNKGEQE